MHKECWISLFDLELDDVSPFTELLSQGHKVPFFVAREDPRQMVHTVRETRPRIATANSSQNGLECR